jgi:hypothetical protein
MIDRDASLETAYATMLAATRAISLWDHHDGYPAWFKETSFIMARFPYLIAKSLLEIHGVDCPMNKIVYLLRPLGRKDGSNECNDEDMGAALCLYDNKAWLFSFS